MKSSAGFSIANVEIDEQICSRFSQTGADIDIYIYISKKNWDPIKTDCKSDSGSQN